MRLAPYSSARRREELDAEPAASPESCQRTPPTAASTADGRRRNAVRPTDLGRSAASRRVPVRVVRSSAEAKRTEKRSLWVYVKHALMHPWHVVVLAGATVFGVANWSLLVLLLVFAGAELMLLGVVLHLRAFRHYVDERLDQIDRGRAAEQRATLLLQMGDEHRRELLRLESIVDRIRDATTPHGTAAQIAVDECLRLLASYVRLAIAHNVSRECLASVNRRGLEDEIRDPRGRALRAGAAHARARPAAHRDRPASAPTGGTDRASRSTPSGTSSR